MMAQEGHSVRSVTALLNVSESGYYRWRRRTPCDRLLRRAWLSELIVSIHRASNAAYGSRRIHHELQCFYGVTVSRKTVELLMRQAGITGRTGRSGRSRPADPGPPRSARRCTPPAPRTPYASRPSGPRTPDKPRTPSPAGSGPPPGR
ncbi:IS3 family transposase [Streptomyces sp. NPDC002265]|uniref:IS3 family transposase n=1 Tax=Streptomyces sp. NPDC002265 TaxID=3154415 RepID=UPI003331DA4A